MKKLILEIDNISFLFHQFTLYINIYINNYLMININYKLWKHVTYSILL